MHGIKTFHGLLLLGLILFSVKDGYAQANPARRTKALVVNGKTLDAQVTQIDGHSYVDIETLAQIANAAVTVEPNRIVLTIPATAAGAAGATTAAATSSAPPAEGISRDFAAAAIGTLADMRDWRAATSMMITYGLVVSASWTTDYRDRVQADLSQAAVAATTASDRNAMPLLQSEFDKLNEWTNETLAARQALNGAKTVDPNALKNDPALQKINDCGRFLNGMIVSRAFSDNASCH